MARDFSGWQLRAGKKGSTVGKTKRGKGTKWMVLVDGPHEATLAEATLAQVKVPRPRGWPRQRPEPS